MLISEFQVRTFAPPEVEQEFLTEYSAQFLNQRRLALIVGTTAFGIFFIWDWMQVDEFGEPAFSRVETIRLVALLIVIAIARIGWEPTFLREQSATFWMIAALSICWVALLAMMAVAPLGMTLRGYYPGLLLCYYFAFTFLRLRAYPAIATGAALLILFVVTEVGIVVIRPSSEPVDFYGWFSATFFLVASCCIGAAAATQLELAARRDFSARRKLAEAKSQTDTALERIATQNTQMQQLLDEKQRFFSSAYHDIQQPLSTINLFIRSAKHNSGSQDALIRDLEVIEKAALDILDMFKDIQEYSELGTYEPRIMAIDISTIVDEVFVQYEENVQGKGLRFDRWRSSAPPFVMSDRALLKRVVSNLVSNALKHTVRGGVVIGLVRISDVLRVDVRDTGVGIAQEHREKIFSEYFQVGNPGRDRAKGLGLGLSIVKRAIEIMPNHRLTFHSVIGRGSRFSVYLPIATMLPYKLPLEARHPATVTLAGRYAIVCDDDDLVLEGLRRLLESAGALVDVAQSLTEVYSLLENCGRAPDIVVTDIRLREGMLGMQVGTAIRSAFPWAQRIPVAFITGELVSPQSLQDFAPPFALLRKSYAPDMILTEIERLLKAEQSDRASDR